MDTDLIAIGVAYAAGLAARFVGLPPLIGYLLAGFGLYAAGTRLTPLLEAFSSLGVTLLLFTIGLKLRPSSLLMPQIWAVASLHMAIIVVTVALLMGGLAVAGMAWFAALDPSAMFVIAFALGFSSTVFAVKVLEEKGEAKALYGRIAIGILIMQDIMAVVFLAFSAGKVPTVWALGLLALIPLYPVLHRLLERSGHGELQILFGLMLALGGAHVFELVGVKGDLGALILGVMLSSNQRASELARHLLGFKDLFLVGFFLSIGLSAPLTWNAFFVALLLLLLVPVKTVLFFGLLSAFRLRARTALLGALSLANYSEFGLIVAAVAVANGWIGGEWLIIVAIAVALSFMLAAPLNQAGETLYARFRPLWLRFESARRIAAEQAIDIGDTRAIVFGVGRVGSGALEALRGRFDGQVLGVDIDPETVSRRVAGGVRVIRGSATEPDFWDRLRLDPARVELILLTMPNLGENLLAVRQLERAGYRGRIAAVAKYDDDMEQLRAAGVDSVFNLYAEAGSGFAEHVWQDLFAGKQPAAAAQPST